MIVNPVEFQASPSGVIPIEVNARLSGDPVTLLIRPIIGGTLLNSASIRPTSVVLSVSSAFPTSWKLRAFAGTLQTYESRVFATCGNSVTIRARNTRQAPFAIATAVATPGVRWALEAIPATDSNPAAFAGSSMVTGVAYFSVRGAFDVDATTYTPSTAPWT